MSSCSVPATTDIAPMQCRAATFPACRPWSGPTCRTPLSEAKSEAGAVSNQLVPAESDPVVLDDLATGGCIEAVNGADSRGCCRGLRPLAEFFEVLVGEGVVPAFGRASLASGGLDDLVPQRVGVQRRKPGHHAPQIAGGVRASAAEVMLARDRD